MGGPPGGRVRDADGGPKRLRDASRRPRCLLTYAYIVRHRWEEKDGTETASRVSRGAGDDRASEAAGPRDRAVPDRAGRALHRGGFAHGRASAHLFP